MYIRFNLRCYCVILELSVRQFANQLLENVKVFPSHQKYFSSWIALCLFVCLCFDLERQNSCLHTAK